MSRRFASSRVAVFVCGTLIAVVGLVGVAAATIPDSSGVIHGCVVQRTGALRVIDDASQTCRSKEASLKWNQAGERGPAGSTVLWWQPIFQFQSTGVAAHHEMACPTGYQAINAGYKLEGVGRLGQAIVDNRATDNIWVLALEPTGDPLPYNLTVRVECFDGLVTGGGDD